MVGPAVKILPPAQAGKKQRAMNGIFPVVPGVAFQGQGQILGRSFGVPQMKLHQLPLFKHFPNRQSPAAVIHSHHIAD